MFLNYNGSALIVFVSHTFSIISLCQSVQVGKTKSSTVESSVVLSLEVIKHESAADTVDAVGRPLPTIVAMFSNIHQGEEAIQNSEMVDSSPIPLVVLTK